MMSGFREKQKTLLAQWSSRQSYFLLIGITLLCLLPFSGRAFHIDDPLFVWSGQQIAKHPLDTYGTGMQRGDVLAVPENNADAYRKPAKFVASTNVLQIRNSTTSLYET